MLRLAFDFIITWRETRTRPNAYDDSFKYNSQGDLIADNTYYSQRQMLYQIITRTRKKLHIVIIDNEVMLDRCIDILNK